MSTAPRERRLPKSSLPLLAALLASCHPPDRLEVTKGPCGPVFFAPAQKQSSRADITITGKLNSSDRESILNRIQASGWKIHQIFEIGNGAPKGSVPRMSPPITREAIDQEIANRPESVWARYQQSSLTQTDDPATRNLAFRELRGTEPADLNKFRMTPQIAGPFLHGHGRIIDFAVMDIGFDDLFVVAFNGKNPPEVTFSGYYSRSGRPYRTADQFWVRYR